MTTITRVEAVQIAMGNAQFFARSPRETAQAIVAAFDVMIREHEAGARAAAAQMQRAAMPEWMKCGGPGPEAEAAGKPAAPVEQDNTGLSPCPFCGGEAWSLYDDIGSPQIHCSQCAARGPGGVTEAEAIAFWSRRASPPPLTEADLREILAGEMEREGYPATATAIRNGSSHGDVVRASLAFGRRVAALAAPSAPSAPDQGVCAGDDIAPGQTVADDMAEYRAWKAARSGTMTEEEIVEECARAHWERDGSNWLDDIENEDARKLDLADMRAALARYRELTGARAAGLAAGRVAWAIRVAHSVWARSIDGKSLAEFFRTGCKAPDIAEILDGAP